MKSRDAFTLIELMIVVVIIGILAAVAIPTFMSYVKRSRTTEATTFLGEIRARQDSYKAEHGQYCDASGSLTSYIPASLMGSDAQQFTPTGGWLDLGARPDGLVRFQYSSLAGLPGTTPPGGLGYDGLDFWFVSQAQGDLDGDGMTVLFEAYSHASHIFCNNAKGWE